MGPYSRIFPLLKEDVAIVGYWMMMSVWGVGCHVWGMGWWVYGMWGAQCGVKGDKCMGSESEGWWSACCFTRWCMMRVCSVGWGMMKESILFAVRDDEGKYAVWGEGWQEWVWSVGWVMTRDSMQCGVRDDKGECAVWGKGWWRKICSVE